MRAWWPPRSSKPLKLLTGLGGFDSFTFRHSLYYSNLGGFFCLFGKVVSCSLECVEVTLTAPKGSDFGQQIFC